MGQLVFQATAGGQVALVGPNPSTNFSLNVPAVNSTLATLAAQTFTGQQTDTVDASISGLTVGKGGGTATNSTAVGLQALFNASSTGTENSAFGRQALYSLTSGGSDVAVGNYALYSNTTGTSNTALGYSALQNNTTASNNTAVGYQAVYSNSTGSENVGIGYQALYSNTNNDNTAVGYQALKSNTSGYYNSAFGAYAGVNTTTGTSNTAIGESALYANTTASNNTAVGYQAGYTNSTGNYNTFIGYQTGYYSTGQFNTFVGYSSGISVTSGSKNTILGYYSGNQGGLDIRTASNYIVLSDGDGNPRQVINSSGDLLVGTTSNTTNGGFIFSPNYFGTGRSSQVIGHINGASSGDPYIVFNYNGIGIGSITQTGTTAVLYNTTSDYRLKNDVTPIQNALATVEALNPVSFTWTDGRKDDGFLAHEIQAVIPNCVTGEKDAVNEDGTPKYQQMDNSGVIPFLVKAIQELKAEVDSLKQQLGK